LCRCYLKESMRESERNYNSFRCLFWVFLLSLLVGFRWYWPGSVRSWEDVDNLISDRYPQVKHISTTELLSLYTTGQKIFIFDIRTEKEFTVSHLHGAIRAEEAGVVDLPEDSFIVAYCSVGVRSAEFIRDLQQQGFFRVYNLKGSLFEWASRGYPMEQDGASTQYVHPYNSQWGELLDSELHRYQPDKKGNSR